MSDPRKPSKRSSSRDIEYDPASDITEKETIGHTLPRKDLRSLDKLTQAIQQLFEEQNELHAMVKVSPALSKKNIRDKLDKFSEVYNRLLALAHQEDKKVNEKIVALCKQSKEAVRLDIQSFQATLNPETQPASRMKKPKVDMKTLIDELDTMLEEMKNAASQATPTDSADSEDDTSQKSDEMQELDKFLAKKSLDLDEMLTEIKHNEEKRGSALGTYSKFSERDKSQQYDSDQEEKKEKASEKKPNSNPS